MSSLRKGLSVPDRLSSQLLAKGSVVKLGGLQDRALNGKTGVVTEFCEDNERWAVKVGSRVLAVRECNVTLVPDTSLLPQKRVKLCRYGDHCWRPDCCFGHSHSEERACKWAEYWSSLMSCDATEEDTGQKVGERVSESEGNNRTFVHEASVRGVSAQEVASKIAEVELRLKQAVADIDIKMEESQAALECVIIEKLAIAEDRAMCAQMDSCGSNSLTTRCLRLKASV